jgi:predicted phosphodiesterase
VDWLARLPHPVVLNVDGFGDVVFRHGTPRDDNEVVLVDTRLDRWAEALAELPDHIHTVVCGHTHMPFLHLVHGREIINSGSVGMPYGHPCAHWALLTDGAVSLHRTPFDPDHASVTICRQSSYPDVTAWTDDFLHARASDAEAIRIFGPHDGR